MLSFVFRVCLKKSENYFFYFFILLLHFLTLHLSPVSVSATLISEQPCRQTSKGDGWRALLRAQLTAARFSLATEKQEGESIFISPLADGSQIDIKGDSARGEEWDERSREKEGGARGRSDQGVESRAKGMSKGLRDHRKKANFEDGEGETVQRIRNGES